MPKSLASKELGLLATKGPGRFEIGNRCRRYLPIRQFLCAGGLFLTLVVAVSARAEISGEAAAIDGQTIEVDGQTLRLYAIEAPPLGQTCTLRGKPFPCGKVARDALTDISFGARVVCRVRGEDGQGRLIATCLADGYDLAEGMVHAGWARAVQAAPPHYRAEEREARKDGRGLWRQGFEPLWP